MFEPSRCHNAGREGNRNLPHKGKTFDDHEGTARARLRSLAEEPIWTRGCLDLENTWYQKNKDSSAAPDEKQIWEQRLAEAIIQSLVLSYRGAE
ncbi:hypothetical protein ACEPAI_7742 [Sanghuangporus weigelae]